MTCLLYRENKEGRGGGGTGGGTGELGENAAFKFKKLILHEKTHGDVRIGGRHPPSPIFNICSAKSQD